MTIIKLHIFACEQILHKQIKKRVKNWRKYSVKLHIKPVHAFMKINNDVNNNICFFFQEKQ